MTVINRAKTTLKTLIRLFGFDIMQVKNSPRQTLLGLRSLPIQTVIDVGANTGQFARFISGFFPSAQMYCYEPLAEPFRELKRWARKQEGRVYAYQLALGNMEGEMVMNCHIDHSPSSSLLATTHLNDSYYPFTKRQVPVQVKLTTLDRLFTPMLPQLQADILVKLDVQGYEDRVLAGAQTLLSKARVCILEVSLDLLYQSQADFKTLFNMLDSLDFRYAGNLQQTYGEDGHVIFLDAVFVRTGMCQQL